MVQKQKNIYISILFTPKWYDLVPWMNILYTSKCYLGTIWKCSDSYTFFCKKKKAYLMTDTRLLQQVLLHVSSLYNAPFIEEDLHVFPKAAGVIIPNGFGIPEGCKTCISETAFYGNDWNNPPNKPVQRLPSRTGLACMICCSTQECCPLTAARNWRVSLVLSVFPAPDSPLKHIQTKSMYYILFAKICTDKFIS